jgi:hypothetical protein
MHGGEAAERPDRGGNSMIRKGYQNDFHSIWLALVDLELHSGAKLMLPETVLDTGIGVIVFSFLE